MTSVLNSLAAELAGWQNRIGSIEAGRFADVIATGDPLKDIRELSKVKFVVKGGAVIEENVK